MSPRVTKACRTDICWISILFTVILLVSIARGEDEGKIRRVFVVWPQAPGLEAFLHGLRSGSGGPAAMSDGTTAGFTLVGSMELPRPGESKVGAGSWKDQPHQLVGLVTGQEVTDLIVGPDSNLAHLALQLAVKMRIRVVLVACPDRGAVALPIKGVTAVPKGVDRGSTPSRGRREPVAAGGPFLEDFESLGAAAARLLGTGPTAN